MPPEPLLRVRDLVMHFPVSHGLILRKKVGTVKAVDGVSFEVNRGETLGLVGESGSGKTTLGKCILQIYRATAGEVLFGGVDLCKMQGEELRRMRRRMQPVYQDPYSSLNPQLTVEQAVGEPMEVHGIARGREIRERVRELLPLVGLESDMASRYPHMFSGGQRQRVGIARALASEPDLLVCDEPVSALDISIQAQIVNLLMDLRERRGLTYIFIGHDLSVVKHISNRVAVMYLGKIVEMAESESLYANALHPYTRALLQAVPLPDPAADRKRDRTVLQGEIPSPLNPPSGCAFHNRCIESSPPCAEAAPPLKDLAGHWVACHKRT